jgi:hypothetical protein
VFCGGAKSSTLHYGRVHGAPLCVMGGTTESDSALWAGAQSPTLHYGGAQSPTLRYGQVQSLTLHYGGAQSPTLRYGQVQIASLCVMGVSTESDSALWAGAQNPILRYGRVQSLTLNCNHEPRLSYHSAESQEIPLIA